MHALARRQLRKAFGDDVPDRPELAAFVDAVSDAYAAHDADRRLSEHAVQLASDELYARNAQLEAQLAELRRLEREVASHAAALDRRNRELSTILDNVDQGFVCVGFDGRMPAGYSSALARWFGTPELGSPLWTYLARDAPEVAAWIELGFDSLRSGATPVDVALAQLPSELVRGARTFRASYQPVGTPANAVLVVINDITEERARRQLERTQRDLMAALEAAHQDRAGFATFLREGTALLRDHAVGALTDVELFRKVHTLKSSAAMFEVGAIADACEALEVELADGAGATAGGWSELVDAWHRFHGRVSRLLDISSQDAVVIDRAAYRGVVDAAAAHDAAWAIELRRWGQDAARPHLERLGDQARALARRLGKAELDVEIVDRGPPLEAARFDSLWQALVHAVRNAVDHGVEPADTRARAGKPARAHLRLAAQTDGDQLVIELADDGAGVDWAAVAARAAALGLPSATRHDLCDALFADRLSTTTTTTATSGRGIGMAALRAAALALGGQVELASEPGCGTTLRCVVPLATSAAASPPAPPAPGAARPRPATPQRACAVALEG